MKYRLATIVGGIGLVAVGVVLYLYTADNFAACASTIGGFVRALDPASARDCARISAERYASIAFMIFGGVVMLIGLISGKRPT